MLKSIYISNFAIINELELDFYAGMSVLTGETGAGKSILLEFPVIATGEVDGMVYLRRGTSVVGLSNVELQLVNTEGEVVQQTKTAFDGFYLFTYVRPGRYFVRISPDQIERLKLVKPPDQEVVIGGGGTIVSGVDLTIERAR